LGIGKFHLADNDVFDWVDLNRLPMSSLGRGKVEMAGELALDINPEVELSRFPDGVGESNLDAFLKDVDVYVDGLGFFAMDTRERVFAGCAERGIPAILAVPLGWGTALLVFAPGGYSFEEYFQMSDESHLEKMRRFLVGLSPTAMELQAMVEPGRLDFINERWPFTWVGVHLSVGMVTMTVVKLLLGRGEVQLAPWSMHCDTYSNRYEFVDRPGGMSHPELQAYLERLRAATGE
jgi:hypothetical protein